MKIKTAGRLAGAVNATIGLTMGSFAAYYLSQSDYDLISLLSSSDIPFSYKALGSGFLTGLGVGIPLISLVVADGLTDVVKGTHHYFGCRVWQRFTRNPEMKSRIERDLRGQLQRLEEDI